MFTGVTAGSVAFAELDDELDDLLEDFCEIDATEHDVFFDENPDLADFRDEITDFCTIEDEIEREDAIDVFVEENFPEAIEEDDEVIDDFEDCVEAGYPVTDSIPEECTFDDMVFVNDEDDDNDDVIDSFEDCVEAGYPVMESYPEQCMTDDGTVFVNDDDDDSYYDDRYANDDKFYVCHNDKNTISIAESAVRAHIAHGDSMGRCHDGERDYDDKMYDKDMREMVDRYCEMLDEDKQAFLAEHDKAAEHVAKMNEYCSLDDDAREDFIRDHIDEYKDQMKDKMKDFKKETKMLVDGMKDKHKEYSRYCDMTEEERAASIDSLEKLERISEWCNMTPEEKDAFKKEHRDAAKDLKEKRHDALERMKEKSDLSPRLRAMIMEKHDISDERLDEIKMKYREKHGDLTDDKKKELKMKFKNHMASMKFQMSDERKSAIHDRVAEMKAFKAELRDRASEITNEEKQALRAEFIEKAKDMQLAWISPRHQMHAGVDATEIECREGFSHVLKASNGVAMCLKADTALKMITRGIAVPVN